MLTRLNEFDIMMPDQEEQGRFPAEEIEELVKRYELEEDAEHIIIPLPSKDGQVKRCYLLKRKSLLIQFPDGHFSDFPLAEIVEATVKYPELLLSESLHFVHKTLKIGIITENSDNGDNSLLIGEKNEKENID
jgi:hypothetical protein